MMKNKIGQFIEDHSWIWAFLGCVFLWLAIGIKTSQFGLDSLVSNAKLACFLAIVSFGQMFAITVGEGSIDLSIPYVITFTAFLSIGIANGSNSLLIVVILAALAFGVLVGTINTVTTTILHIPPIIATMALGFVLNTGVLLLSTNFRTSFAGIPVLAALTKGSILGIPWIVIVTLIIAGIVGLVITKLSYGRALMAVGQNRLAAYFAGIKVKRTIWISYILCSCFAALGGVLIAARTGGAYLSLGDAYLLQSIGVVVIGGTLIAGGKATTLGTLFGSLFMLLLVTFMNTSNWSIGVQYVVQGLIIISILSLAVSKTGDRA